MFTVRLKKNLKNVQNPLVYSRQERNTNRSVMKTCRRCEKFTCMRETRPAGQSSYFSGLLPCLLPTRSLGSPGPHCFDCKMGILLLSHFAEVMNILSKILAAEA